MSANLKYQTGQQFFIRVKPNELAFRVRIKGFSKNSEMYCVQRIGYTQTAFMTEAQLDRYIHMVDNH